MKIHHPQLLVRHSNFSMFWKSVLEQLSLEHAPFFSSLRSPYLYIEDSEIALTDQPEIVVEQCKAAWHIPEPLQEIKKDTLKFSLLYTGTNLRQVLQEIRFI